MPPWGTDGVLKPEDIVDVVAFLKTQKSPVSSETNPERNPAPGRGRRASATTWTPRTIRAWSARRTLPTSGGRRGRREGVRRLPPGGPAAAMRGVATRYPRYVAAYRRVMAVEDFIAVHGPETTGTALFVESAANLDLTLLIKMSSNGMPVALDLAVPENAAALERGKRSFHRRVGQRNHACADCHNDGGRQGRRQVPRRPAPRRRSGRAHPPLPDVAHEPGRRVGHAQAHAVVHDPLGANMLAADAVEYAELELYLASFDTGKPLNVPGIRH